MRQNPKGHEHEYMLLKSSQLRFDETYQRPLDESRVHKIVKEFNGDVFNEPKVSFRDGQYWCFDGRQSTAVWQTFHCNPDEPIYCKVFYGMTWDDEVESFIQQTGLSKAVADTYKLKAKYNRKDAEIVDMVRIVTSLGWEIDFEGNGKTPNRIKAVNALYKAYLKIGPVAFKDMMTVIREAWGIDQNAVTVQIISGMKYFYQTFYGTFKHSDLVNSLRNTTPLDIIRYGKSNAYMQSNTYAKEIWKQYNRKRRNRLEDKL